MSESGHFLAFYLDIDYKVTPACFASQPHETISLQGACLVFNEIDDSVVHFEEIHCYLEPDFIPLIVKFHNY